MNSAASSLPNEHTLFDTTVVKTSQSLQVRPTGSLRSLSRDRLLRSLTKDRLYPDFGVKIVNGCILFWVFERWQDFPNETWAWKYVTVWTVGHYYYGCSIWVPSLLLFDFWQYNSDQTWSPHPQVSTSVIVHQSTPAATAIIGPLLFATLRSSRNSELCRTCRLVCRDWANACSLRDAERCDLRDADSIVWYRIEESWRHLPSNYWAWTLLCEEWWVDRRQPEGRWSLKLVQPVDDSVRRNPRYPSTLSTALSPSRSGFLRAAALPPELFKYICDAADGESWSSRLVCRYWHRLCTPRVFEHIDVEESPERIRAVWRRRKDQTFRRFMRIIENIPRYDEKSKFPWLHFLSQACASTESTSSWRYLGGMGRIAIWGPFAGGYRTIRSVHFSLPRSLPRPLSRGIMELELFQIRFYRFQDLAHLVCELPDLGELYCTESTFDSLPTEPPRRRPRSSRNKLRKVDIWNDESKMPALPALTLYLDVYDATSFFSEGEIAVTLALLRLLHGSLYNPVVCYKNNHQDLSHALDFKDRLVDFDLECTVLGLKIQPEPGQSRITLKIIIDCSYATARGDSGRWMRLDAEFNKIEGIIRQADCVFGFADRDKMTRFATTTLRRKMPSIYRVADVRYSIHVEDDDKDEYAPRPGQWYQASLESEELTGTGKTDLAEVYP